MAASPAHVAGSGLKLRNQNTERCSDSREHAHKERLKWGCYTHRHGENLGKSSSGRIRANTRKWESSCRPAQ